MAARRSRDGQGRTTDPSPGPAQYSTWNRSRPMACPRPISTSRSREDRGSPWRTRRARSCGSRCYNVPRHIARELDHAAIRAHKAAALHFRLDLRRPESRRTVGIGATRTAADSAGARPLVPGAASSASAHEPRRACPGRHGAVRGPRARPGRHLMLIHRVRLSNFRQHENTDLELGAGLTWIVGPNGAGKTTILEAIALGAVRNARRARQPRDHPPARAPAAGAGRSRAGVHAGAAPATASSVRSTTPSCIRTAIPRRSPTPSGP